MKGIVSKDTEGPQEKRDSLACSYKAGQTPPISSSFSTPTITSLRELLLPPPPVLSLLLFPAVLLVMTHKCMVQVAKEVHVHYFAKQKDVRYCYVASKLLRVWGKD